MRPEDIEKAQGERRDAISVAGDQAHPLLRVFVQRIDRTERWLLGLGRGQRLEEASLVVLQLPFGLLQLSDGAFGRRNRNPVDRTAKAFTVDAHRRGDDDPLDGTLGERFQQYRGAELVSADVRGDVVHALANAN